ncbi:hypothetical protein GIB67_034882 [Kingdonia uniflora]|uniref:Protein kinase domain-containing protein n=1 Tax=Kingdonia uniflora TaxID=39325 RepID=A0A7J7KVW0_9MAGN|nr:hypothetical protein GIB67_034882 [Kingdonia uniflora]
MEQLRHIGMVLGSLKALMVFKEDIQINQRQCCLLVDMFNLAFEGITEEIKQSLRFEERHTKWRILEQPLKELLRVVKEGELYIQHCLEMKDWWAKAIFYAQNTDCVELHIHDLLCCVPVVIEAIEIVGEISGCDQDEIKKRRLILTKKYVKEWKDPKLFQWNFGKHYLVSQEICNRLDSVWKEDRWLLMETIREKKSLGSQSKQEQQLTELLFKKLDDSEHSNGNHLFPSSILVSSKDYQVKRRLGSGSQYKEINWLGENFAVRHFFGEIEQVIPEISLVSSLSHPNVMQFLCGFSDEEKKECFLVMELMNKDLSSYMKELCRPRKRVPFSVPVAVDLMLQIARGMEYLHSRKIYHGHLNPSNILVKARNSTSEGYLNVKIYGFGSSSIKNLTYRSASVQNGSNPFIWYAPEVLLEEEQPGNGCVSKYSEKADVYSFGMICFELLTGKVPFDDGHLQGDKMSRNIRTGERPLFPFQSPKYLTNLTKKCWHTDIAQRPSFLSICRILRYIKRFLAMNPDHSQPDAPMPLIDYCDVEMGISSQLSQWGISDQARVSQIPFHIFGYRVVEKEKTCLTVRKKSSESGSEGASIGEDDHVCAVGDTLSLISASEMSVMSLDSNNKKISLRKKIADMKASKTTGTGMAKGKLRPPQLILSRGSRSLRYESFPMVISPMLSSPKNKRRSSSSGHASDSELA